MRMTAKLLATITAIAGMASAQVLQTQDGRALDANTRVGSGGFNSLREASGFDGNRYVTGEVTGGREFRGTVGYSGANQLSLDLPSAGVDNFIRGSAGVPQVAGGVNYGVGTYLSPYRTVLSPRAIAEGLNAPGSSVPQTSFVPQQREEARRLYDSAVEAYKPILAEISPRMRVEGRPVPAVEAPDAAAASFAEAAARAGAVRPAASALFGLIRQGDRDHLTAELTEAERFSLDHRVGLPLEADVKAEPAQAEPLGTPTTPAAKPAAEPTTPPAGELPAPGENPYFDLLVHLAQIRREVEAAEPPATAEPATETPPAKPRELPPGLMDDQAYAAWQRRQAQKSVERIRDQIVLHSLTGTDKDMFNFRMRRGEASLKEGKYYDAAAEYEIAATINRTNPLAGLGSMLALLGANEPTSAAYHLRRAMTVFPPVMETRVAVKEFLKPEIVEERLVQLQRQIDQAKEAKQTPVPEVVFLATYLRQSLGDRAAAVALARQLKDLAGDDKVLAAYADVVLTGKPPAGALLKSTAAP